MGLTYQIEPDNKIIRQQWIGSFNLKAIKELSDGMYNDPRYQQNLRAFCDVRQASWQITGDEFYLVTEFVRQHPKGPRGPHAIVCSEPLQTAFAMMYSSIDNPPHPSKAFSTEEAAMEWLDTYL